jgi:hypothetical protein
MFGSLFYIIHNSNNAYIINLSNANVEYDFHFPISKNNGYILKPNKFDHGFISPPNSGGIFLKRDGQLVQIKCRGDGDFIKVEVAEPIEKSVCSMDVSFTERIVSDVKLFPRIVKSF